MKSEQDNNKAKQHPKKSIKSSGTIHKKTDEIVEKNKTSDAKSKQGESCDNPIFYKECRKSGWTKQEKITAVAVLLNFIAIIITSISVSQSVRTANIADETFKNSLKKDSAYKKQFEIENRPIIQIGNFGIDNIGNGSNTALSFRIVNLGKFPATIPSFRSATAFGINKSPDEVKKEIQLGDIKPINTTLSNAGYFGEKLVGKPISKDDYLLFKKREKFIYILVEVNYINFGTKEKYKLNVIYKIGWNVGNFDFEGIENLDTSVIDF